MRAAPTPPLPVAAGYDRWAATYDAVANPTRDAAAARLRGQRLELAGARVLELGCGTGADTEWLAAQAAAVTALDFSPAMLACARRRPGVGKVSFVAHDISRPLPVADGAMDLVVENLVLEHLQMLDSLFGEVFRVLRPGGLFVMSELHPYRQLMGKQARFLDVQTDTELLIEAWPHTIAEFVNAAVAAGFRLRGVYEDQGDAAGFPRVFSLTAVKP